MNEFDLILRTTDLGQTTAKNDLASFVQHIRYALDSHSKKAVTKETVQFAINILNKCKPLNIIGCSSLERSINVMANVLTLEDLKTLRNIPTTTIHTNAYVFFMHSSAISLAAKIAVLETEQSAKETNEKE